MHVAKPHIHSQASDCESNQLIASLSKPCKSNLIDSYLLSKLNLRYEDISLLQQSLTLVLIAISALAVTNSLITLLCPF